MPTRDARSLSKTADSPKVRSALSPRPPDPALPLRRRWALSVALAVGLPLALGWAVQRLGPGPHAPVRIELAFQPFGAPGGLAAAGAGSSRKPGPAVAPGRASAVAAAPPASAPGALAPSAAPAQALVPALPAPVRAEPVAAPALVASAPLVPASLLPPPHPSARVSASAESHVPPGTAPAVSGGRGTGAPGTAGLGLAVGNSAGGVPGTGAAGGSVAPEALDAGFGLAAPVRLPYPVAALASGQAGQARIEMEIEPSGRVARVTVLDETAGLGRNTVIGPGLFTIDFSLVKTFVLHERHNLTFRSEFFNLLNRANFQIPQRVVFNSTGGYAGSAGLVQDLATPSRQIQFSLRYSF